MARLRRKNTYLNLQSLEVYKIDNRNEVFRVTNVPSVFPRGKTYFLALGSSLLEQGTDLLIEIIDNEGNVVYHEIPFYLENSGRAISVWVYNDNAVGIATITIVGILKDVPAKWKNKYNVKYQTQILIDPNQDNNSSIKFIKSPEVTVKEKTKKYVSFTQQKTQLLNFNSGSIFGIIPGVSLTTSKEVITSKNYISSSTYEIQLSGSGFEFTKEMIGAKVLVSNPIAYTSSNSYDFQPYTASITGIKNSYTAYVDKPYKLLNTNIDSFEPIQFTTADTSYSIQYVSSETGSSTVFTSSYAKFDFSNLQTFSGRINNVRVYKRDLSTDTSYLHVGDFLIEPRDFLLYETDFNPIEIGIFDSSSKLAYWVTSSIDNNQIVTNNVTQSLDKLYLFNSVKLSRTDEKFKFYPNQKFLFRKDHEYTLTAKFATKLSPYGSRIESSSIDIYVSGSSFNHDIAGDLIGKKIGTLYSNTDKNFGEHQFNFVSDNTASGSISFQINSGYWYLSDISLKPAYDYGFGPDESTIYVPLNSIKRNEVLVFKIEYLSSNNNVATEKTEIEIPTKFVGNPLYIELTDNLLTGSLSIGNVTGSGIEISGLNSAYIRSIGYKGFISASQYNIPGFIIYSGSILSGSGDEYRGLGIEIHAGGNSGSLRYRVDNSGSFLEISGSIYAENGYFTGFVSASSGFIGGWVIGASSIYKIRDSESIHIYSKEQVEPGPNQYDYSGIVIIDNMNKVTGIVATTGSTNPNPYIFAGGDAVYGIDDKPFYVLPDGYLKTNYGTIANWYFSQSILTSSEIPDMLSSGKVLLLSDYSGYVSQSAGVIVNVYGGRYAGMAIRENHDGDTPVLFAGSTGDPFNNDTRWWVDIAGNETFSTIKARLTPAIVIEKIYSDPSLSGSANDALVTEGAIKQYVDNSISTITGSGGGATVNNATQNALLFGGSNQYSITASQFMTWDEVGTLLTIQDNAPSNNFILNGASASFYYAEGSTLGNVKALNINRIYNFVEIRGNLNLTGSLNISGSGATSYIKDRVIISGGLDVQGGITGSLLGSSSYAVSASHLIGGTSTNTYWTSSGIDISRQSSIQVTGSIKQTGSLSDSNYFYSFLALGQDLPEYLLDVKGDVRISDILYFGGFGSGPSPTAYIKPTGSSNQDIYVSNGFVVGDLLNVSKSTQFGNSISDTHILSGTVLISNNTNSGYLKFQSSEFTSSYYDYDWRIGIGNAGNYQGWLKFFAGETNVNNWAMALYPDGTGTYRANFKGGIASPRFATSVTGLGDVSILGFANSGINYSGKTLLGVDHPFGDNHVRVFLGNESTFGFNCSDTSSFTVEKYGTNRNGQVLFSVRNDGYITMTSAGGQAITFLNGQIKNSSQLYLDAGSAGSVFIRPNNSISALVISSSGATVFGANQFLNVVDTGGGNGYLKWDAVGTIDADNFGFRPKTGGSSYRMFINSTGVGIGINLPNAKLDVSGSTHFGNINSDQHNFTGSVNILGGITGSLFGTASYALSSPAGGTYALVNNATQNALLFGGSNQYSITASQFMTWDEINTELIIYDSNPVYNFVLNNASASFYYADGSTFGNVKALSINRQYGVVEITGSLSLSGSGATSYISDRVIISGGLDIQGGITGSLLGSSSYSQTSSYDNNKIVLTQKTNCTTGTNTSSINLTDLSCSLKENSKYTIDLYAVIRSAANTTGIGLAISGSSSVIKSCFMTFDHQLANTGTRSGGQTIGNNEFTGVSSGVPGTVNVAVKGSGFIDTSTSPGNIQFVFRAEVAAITNFLSGSIVVLNKVF